MNRLQLSNQLQNQCTGNNIEIAFAGADMILIVHFLLLYFYDTDSGMLEQQSKRPSQI